MGLFTAGSPLLGGQWSARSGQSEGPRHGHRWAGCLLLLVRDRAASFTAYGTSESQEVRKDAWILGFGRYFESVRA